MSADRAALPHAPEAERSVLGALLLPDPDRAVLSRVLALLRPADFYSDRHQCIFAGMVRVHARGEAVDLVTLSSALREASDLERAGDVAWAGVVLVSTRRSPRSHACRRGRGTP